MFGVLLKKPVLSILAMMSLAGASLACYTVVESRRTPPASRPIVEPPSRPEQARMIAGSGLVEARRENIPIGVGVPGVVVEIFVKKGELVTANAPLFRVDDREMKAMLRVREAELASARAQLHKLVAAPRPEDVPPAQAALDEARAKMDDAEAATARTERLYTRQVAPASDYDKDRYTHAAAKAAFAKARAELERVLAGSWKEDIEVAKAAVMLAESQIESIKINLDRLIVRAPTDGEILQLNVRLGQYAGLVWKEPMVVMGDSKRLHVRVDVDENDLPFFTKGAPRRRDPERPAQREVPARICLCRALCHPQAIAHGLQLGAGRYAGLAGDLLASRRALGRCVHWPADGRLFEGRHLEG